MWKQTIALATAVLIAGCGSAPSNDARPVRAADSAHNATSNARSDHQKALPVGWRWENYGDVEVGVPDGWGEGTSDSPWCALRTSSRHRPYVGRPGPVLAIGCVGHGHGPDPGTLVSVVGPFVWFAGPIKPRQLAPRLYGDRITLTVTGIRVSVQAETSLRDRILATIHTTSHGSNGCPAASPVSQRPDWRPHGPPIQTLTGVVALSACNYTPGLLRSTLRLTGERAAAAVTAIAHSPIGGGPNDPPDCLPAQSYGDEMLVLRIQSDQGTSQVVLRYAGCDHHGFDDGTTVRTLTRGAVRPFLTGPNRVMEADRSIASIVMD